MQPTLVLCAPQPGILYINGRFAGEISNDTPLMRPVSSRGAVYLDFRPLTNACDPIARKLVFSGGEPLTESAESASNLNIVLWPGGAVEIEFCPDCRITPRYFSLSGHSFILDGNRLHCDNRLLCSLPAGAEVPRLQTFSGGNLLIGNCAGGKYLLVTDADFTRQTGFLHARQLETENDGSIRSIADPCDLVGHAVSETWNLTPQGLMLASREAVWANGSPRWPATPAETVRAALEAALSGLSDEAEAYLSPALRTGFSFDVLKERCDLCVEMKYAPPDSRPCAGMLQLLGEHTARVAPLYYRVSPSAEGQGPWQIDALEWE